VTLHSDCNVRYMYILTSITYLLKVNARTEGHVRVQPLVINAWLVNVVLVSDDSASVSLLVCLLVCLSVCVSSWIAWCLELLTLEYAVNDGRSAGQAGRAWLHRQTRSDRTTWAHSQCFHSFIAIANVEIQIALTPVSYKLLLLIKNHFYTVQIFLHTS